MPNTLFLTINYIMFVWLSFSLGKDRSLMYQNFFLFDLTGIHLDIIADFHGLYSFQ